MRPKLGPLGDCGIRIEFGDEIRPAINTRIRRFLSALDADPIHGVTERAYGYAVVTVYYQPWVIDSETLCAALTERLQRSTNTQAAPSRQIEIPVCYGGEFGPDLEEVAAYHHLSSAQVIQKHCRPRYLVYFLGFLPGFAYLGGPAGFADDTAPVDAARLCLCRRGRDRRGTDGSLPLQNARRLADHWANSAPALRGRTRDARAAGGGRLGEVRADQRGGVLQTASERNGERATSVTRLQSLVYDALRNLFMRRIDLNADLGESFGVYTLGDDEALLRLVTSANIACGFHAGDPSIMAQTAALAATQNVAIGAHPGLLDLIGFGRRRIAVTLPEVRDLVTYQIGALAGFAARSGQTLQHVKPHGALYSMAEEDGLNR